MATIDQLIKRAKSLKFREIIRESVEETRSEIVQAQRDQMLHGLKSDGKKIGKYKNPDYARKKYQMNQLAGMGNVDLKYTGEFQSEAFVDTRNDSVVFGSADNVPVDTGDGTMGKTDKLVEQYGGDIFGLSPSYAAEYSQNHLGPIAQNKIIKKLTK